MDIRMRLKIKNKAILVRFSLLRAHAKHDLIETAERDRRFAIVHRGT